MRNIVGSIALGFVVTFGSASASAQETKPAQAAAAPAKASASTGTKRAASRSDVSVGAALARCDDAVVMHGPALAPATPSRTTAAPVKPAPIVEANEGNGLAGIHVTQSHSSGRAGTARDVELSAGAPASKTARPVATVRMQRKMSVDRAMASVAPAIEACRAMAGPSANGTVAVQLYVSATGEVERADLASAKGPMAKPAVSCVLAALGNARFGAPGPLGASLTVPVALVQDRGDVTRVALAD